MLEFVREMMEMGYSEETACREWQALNNPNYDPEDYENDYQ